MFKHSYTCGHHADSLTFFASRALPMDEQFSTMFIDKPTINFRLSASVAEVSAGFTMVESRLLMPSSSHACMHDCAISLL